VRASVKVNDLYRILALVQTAPSAMTPEDFAAFVGICGEIKNAEESEPLHPATCKSLRVSPDVFGIHYSPTTSKFNKVMVIKAIRNTTGLSLKDAKDMSEGIWQSVSLTAEQIEALQKETPGVLYEVSW
jgi:ribosomal protein L7/L12